MVLLQRPNDGAVRKVAADGGPTAPVVPALEYVGAVVALLVRVRESEERARRVQVGLNFVDERTLRHTGQISGTPPILSCISGNVDETIIRARV